MFELLTALMIGLALWDPAWIPAGSMKPTLLVGDYVLVAPIDGAQVRRGDVITFRHPVRDTSYIKRVIGVGGDRVQMRDGQVYLNGQILETLIVGDFVEPYAPQGPSGVLPRCEVPVAPGASCGKTLIRESLPNGRSYMVLDIRPGPLDNTPEATVPPGHLFVMGDNRDNSVDSRMALPSGGVGMVPIANVTGRADLILFSSAGSLLIDIFSWREGRSFMGVQ